MLDLYTHEEIDVDYSTYRVIDANVVMYKGGNNAVDAILKRFRETIDQLADVQLFIKRNRLFFTLDGVKYYTTLSVWATEWDVIDECINELMNVAEDVAYMPGELD